MDKRFADLKNIEAVNQRRDRTLGWVLLVVLIGVMLVCNRTVYPLMTWRPGRMRAIAELGIGGLCGVLCAEFSLLIIWVVLSSHSLFRRWQFLLTGLFAMGAAWLLGFISTLEISERIRWSQMDEIYVTGLLPAVLLVGSLPLIVLRRFGGRQIAGRGEQPIRKSASIGGLMVATAVVGIALAALRMPMHLVGPADFWPVFATMLAIVFGFGLLVILPNVLILASSKRSYFVWAPVLIILVASLAFAVGFGLNRATGRNPMREVWVGVTLLTTAELFTALGLGIMRLLGYRLVKAGKASPG